MKLDGCFGMFEMEKAAASIVEACEREGCKFSGGCCASIEWMQDEQERTGYLELLIRGWITSDTPPSKGYRYNGEFFISDAMAERVLGRLRE